MNKILSLFLKVSEEKIIKLNELYINNIIYKYNNDEYIILSDAESDKTALNLICHYIETEMNELKDDTTIKEKIKKLEDISEKGRGYIISHFDGIEYTYKDTENDIEYYIYRLT